MKFQNCGHLMQRADSLEKTLMLGKIEGRRRRGRQRVRRLEGITDSVDMGLSRFQETVEVRSLACCGPHGVTNSRTRLSNSNTTSGHSLPSSTANSPIHGPSKHLLIKALSFEMSRDSTFEAGDNWHRGKVYLTSISWGKLRILLQGTSTANISLPSLRPFMTSFSPDSFSTWSPASRKQVLPTCQDFQGKCLLYL